jgi:DNA-binding NarL/FixJ family response regulator
MAPEPVTRKRDPHRVALISDGGELEQRIAIILPAAGLEVERSEAPLPEDSKEGAPAAVVAAVSGTAASTAAKIKKLRRRIRNVPLVVVIPTGRSGPEARAAISAGADGAVLERDMENTLAATVAVAAGGQVAFPDTLLQAPKQPSFTRREKQGLGMMVLGFTNQEIGARLGLAETTIKSHLCSAFEKLGVSSRAEASALFLDAANGVGLDALAIEPDEVRRDQT